MLEEDIANILGDILRIDRINHVQVKDWDLPTVKWTSSPQDSGVFVKGETLNPKDQVYNVRLRNIRWIPVM